MKNLKTTIPFTYSIYQKSSDKWYYGVKYADGCSPHDLGTTYFSSSRVIRDLIKEFGIDDFVFKIRKQFKDKKSAIDWELRFLNKIKTSRIRYKFLNKCFAIAFWPIMYGELNPAKRLEVRDKLSHATKNRSKIISLEIGKKTSTTNVKNKIISVIIKIKPYKSNLTLEILKELKIENKDMIINHIKFLKNTTKKFKNILKLYESILIILELPKIKKPMKKGIKRFMSEETRIITNEKIAIANSGKVYAENIFTNEKKKVKIEEIGEIWKITSMHSDETLKLISESSKNCSEETREKLSEFTKNSRSNSKYYTSPDMVYYKSFKNDEVIPENWIPGIKVESRNKKIGKNNRWSKVRNDEKNS